MIKRTVNLKSYNDFFSGDAVSNDSKKAKALSVALDIRKFEIELYWKRAAYFWIFTGAALAAHLNALLSENNYEVLLLTSCIGFVFAFAWYLVNRASKFWQANWEKHVDLLENAVHGPLYKIIIDTPPWWKLHKAYPLSVSKINQLLSLFIVVIFIVLIMNTVCSHYELSCKWQLFPTACFVLTTGAIVSLLACGRSSNEDRYIIKPEDEEQ
jgi:hypothetical protein